MSNLIRKGKVDAIVNAIQSGRSKEMRALDDALEKLVKAEAINGEDAKMNAIDIDRFEP